MRVRLESSRVGDRSRLQIFLQIEVSLVECPVWICEKSGVLSHLLDRIELELSRREG